MLRGEFCWTTFACHSVLQLSSPQTNIQILQCMNYLPTIRCSGGGTKFDDLNFTAEPKKGMALVWPSMTNDLKEMDDWTWHEALPVEKGIKYGANAWIHLRDYQNVPGWCM